MKGQLGFNDLGGITPISCPGFCANGQFEIIPGELGYDCASGSLSRLWIAPCLTCPGITDMSQDTDDPGVVPIYRTPWVQFLLIA